ncbi:MAG: aldo/keto reductase, partial [Clostridia bacterium]
ERGAALLCYAAERGVNFVDTAEYYHTYPPIARALRAHPELIVCTKSYAWNRETAMASVRQAQELLGRSYIDIFMMHEQESIHTLRGHEEALRYYQQCQREGTIGAVGISTHHIAAVRAAIWFGGIDIIFPILNVRGLGIADGTREEMEQAIQAAHDAGVGILAMKALGGGHMLADREHAFSYIRSLTSIDAVAVGMQSEAEIDYNAAIFSGRTPSDDAARDSASAPRKMQIADWCEGCGRCVRRCGQHALSIQNKRAVVEETLCVRCGYCAAVCPQFCIKII